MNKVFDFKQKISLAVFSICFYPLEWVCSCINLSLNPENLSNLKEMQRKYVSFSSLNCGFINLWERKRNCQMYSHNSFWVCALSPCRLSTAENVSARVANNTRTWSSGVANNTRSWSSRVANNTRSWSSGVANNTRSRGRIFQNHGFCSILL